MCIMRLLISRKKEKLSGNARVDLIFCENYLLWSYRHHYQIRQIRHFGTRIRNFFVLLALYELGFRAPVGCLRMFFSSGAQIFYAKPKNTGCLENLETFWHHTRKCSRVSSIFHNLAILGILSSITVITSLLLAI